MYVLYKNIFEIIHYTCVISLLTIITNRFFHVSCSCLFVFTKRNIPTVLLPKHMSLALSSDCDHINMLDEYCAHTLHIFHPQHTVYTAHTKEISLIQSWYTIITCYIPTDVISLKAWYFRNSKVFSDLQCPWICINLSAFCNALKIFAFWHSQMINFSLNMHTRSGVNRAL
jgi:hypothetical protein